MRFGQSEVMHMLLQRFLVSVMSDAQAYLSTFTTDGSDDWRTVILIRAVSTQVIGAAARRIGRLKVFVTFFPQHSETFHRFQYAHRGEAYLAVLFLRWLAPHGAGLAP